MWESQYTPANENTDVSIKTLTAHTSTLNVTQRQSSLVAFPPKLNLNLVPFQRTSRLQTPATKRGYVHSSLKHQARNI